METLWQDIRYGLRMLARKPGFTAVAVLTLALGIGANTAVFSIVNALLLRPLPVEQPDRLVALIHGEEGIFAYSYSDYAYYRDHNQVFSGLAAYSVTVLVFGDGGQREIVAGEIVSSNYFSVLGVDAARGRTFLPEEGRVPGGHPVAVVSHNFWKRRFGSDPALLGKTIVLNGHRFTVVGIAPEGFTGAFPPVSVEFWVPLMMRSQVQPGVSEWLSDWRENWLMPIGRLKTGVKQEEAVAVIRTLDRQIEQAYPETDQRDNSNARPPWEVGDSRLVPLHGIIFPSLRRVIAPVTGIVMTVVGLVLLIACANVANLLLEQASVRRREMAIRLALGAGRGRLARQLLTESVLLALMAAAAALVLSLWTADFLMAFSPPSPWPVTFSANLGPDIVVLGFTLLLALLASLVFGLAPALQASNPDLVPALKDEATLTGRSSRWFGLRNLLVVAQVAVSLLLLITTGLFVRSLQSAQSIDPGFETEKGLFLPVGLSLQGYTEVRGREFYKQMKDRLRALPGVQTVGLTSHIPLRLWPSISRITIEGRAEPVVVRSAIVDSQFFPAMGIALVQGRSFSNLDQEKGPAVIIINETMAQRFWPGQDAIGKRFRMEGRTSSESFRQVIGVVRDSAYLRLGEDPIAFMYLPFSQMYLSKMIVVVRTASDPKGIVADVRREVQALDETLPVPNIKTLSEHMEFALGMPRIFATVVGIFGLLALLLAAVGIYGVVAYSVAQRTHEIGIRMALGAQRQDIFKLVVGQGMLLALIGVGIGLAASFALTRFLSSLLFGVSATDPVTFAGVALLLASVALVACYLPARRATKVDPMVALRYE